MDDRIFDRLARALGAPGSRRAAIGALAALLGAQRALDVATGAPQRAAGKPSAAGPCGDGSVAYNKCKSNQQCCTGICKKSGKRKDGLGRCRCRQESGRCTETRNCCGYMQCIDRRCVRKKLDCLVYSGKSATENGKALQAMIDAVEPGTVISIEPGEYVGDFMVKKSLSLVRCGDRGEVVLRNRSAAKTSAAKPESSGRTIVLSGKENYISLEDITIKRNAATAIGGGIAILKGPFVRLVGSTKVQGCVHYRGGGVYSESGLLITGCDQPGCGDTVKIGGAGAGEGNRAIGSATIAPDGGGVYLRLTAQSQASFWGKTTITGNIAGGARSGRGGGVFLQGDGQDAGPVYLEESSEISGNRAIGELDANAAPAAGGGIAVRGGVTLHFRGTARVVNNAAGSDSGSQWGNTPGNGGGIDVDGATLFLTASAETSGNVAHRWTTAGGNGGGVRSSETNALLIGDTTIRITGNTADTGGGVYQENGLQTSTGLTSTVVTGNTAQTCSDYYQYNGGTSSVCAI
jgi:hypothetical protein